MRFGRIIGVALVCAVAWGSTSSIYLVELPEDSCCLKGHDVRKCPCRRCAHSRDVNHCFYEQCGGTSSHAVAFLLDVFVPCARFHVAAAVREPRPPELRPQPAPERPTEVPTPPA